MNQREKLMAGGLLAVLGLWQGSVQYQSFVMGPVEDRQRQITERLGRLDKKEIEVAKGVEATRKYKLWKQRSLPPDPVNAANLYQNWLVELANKTKLTDVAVTPKSMSVKSKGDVYTVVSADVVGKGKLSQVRDFLYEFRSSGLLHRIAKVSLTSSQGTGDPTVEFTCTVDGLALKDATPRSTLLSDPKVAELVKTPPKDDFELISKSSLFVRGYNGPPREPRKSDTQRTSPDDDPRQFIRLTSTFSEGGEEYDATLYDPTTNKTANLFAGGEFSIGGVSGKVVDVTLDFVVLEIQGERFRLDLGHTLADLEKMPPAKDAVSKSDG
ncbi:MAG: hypothetical protein JSS02_01495 [Planctomycetes bacterium]|nr:hypothetical protein [Planctomycetota bacterium]